MIRHTKILTVSAEMFVDMFLTIQKGEWIGCEGIPEDLSVLNAAYDLQTMCFKILVESDTFEEVAPYSISPEFQPLFKKYSTQGWERKDQLTTVAVPQRIDPYLGLDPTTRRREIKVQRETK